MAVKFDPAGIDPEIVHLMTLWAAEYVADGRMTHAEITAELAEFGKAARTRGTIRATRH